MIYSTCLLMLYACHKNYMFHFLTSPSFVIIMVETKRGKKHHSQSHKAKYLHIHIEWVIFPIWPPEFYWWILILNYPTTVFRFWGPSSPPLSLIHFFCSSWRSLNWWYKWYSASLQMKIWFHKFWPTMAVNTNPSFLPLGEVPIPVWYRTGCFYIA